jgi:hypothetical protein
MQCFKPLTGYRAPGGQVVFNPARAWRPLREETVPCGRCIGCRLKRSAEWSLRIMHEASLHDNNCFLTLTYDDKNIPHDGSLVKSDFQKFLKRYRKDVGRKIKYYMCGEYGSEYKLVGQSLIKIDKSIGRPHYHACILGNSDLMRSDLELVACQNGNNLYTSETLEKLWPKGFVSVGQLTIESAAYVARYIMKKVTGDDAEAHYQKTCRVTGNVNQLQPEYATMSLRPAIGKEWYDQFKGDLEKDFITFDGKKYKPPKYYDRCLEKESLERFEALKDKRKEFAVLNKSDNTHERLRVKEICTERRVSLLKRTLE